MLGKYGAALLLTFCVLFAPQPVQSRMVHDFDCTECHYEYSSEEQPLMTFNVCLVCHAPGKEAATYTRPDGTESGSTAATFVAGDGSNAMDSNSAPGDETSHYFAGSSDNQPAAGATPPSNFRFNLGWANGQVTCSRCHNPHGDTNNPKLLKLGADSTEAMCLDCHKTWNQTGNHGRGSHPMHYNYPALAAANPDKFKATPDNFGTEGTIALVDDVKISCSSCHGVHWVDSDATTADGKTNANDLSAGDGKLLKFDGAERENAEQSLCTACHSYIQHGRSSGQGCMVCHGGHEYDDGGNPNYFVLKKQVDLNLVPKTEAAGSVDIDYTTYPAPDAQANAVCLGCHDMPATATHLVGSTCKDCHAHDIGFAHNDGIYSNYCLECHEDDHGTDKSQAQWVTLFDSSAHHAWSESGPIDVYSECSLCHPTNVLSPHANDCALCHAGASPPRDSFADWNQGCQQGSCHSSYHAQASDAHDAEYETGCESCHNEPSFDILWPWDNSLPGFRATAEGCGACHTVQPDTTPPVSSTDLQADYIDAALISLWAHDSFTTPTIFYSLDDEAPPQTYSGPITVPAPDSGSQAHTLEFWARDAGGNTELPNLRSFTVSRDTEPPVTSATDAQPFYGTDATIHLEATDNATSFPAAATFFVFDDPDGTPTEGDTVEIPALASGAEEQTLYFWSVDHAGNIEKPAKSVSFTKIADGLEPTSLYLDQVVGFYTEDGASGPRIRYSIYIDGNFIDSFTKTDLGPGTTSWNCPQLAVSSGAEIRIVVDAWFTNYTGTPGGNAPYTYTFNLPDGTVLLEAATWTGFPNLRWEPVDYEEGSGDFAYVEAPQGVIRNIVYVTASPDITPPVTTSNIVADTVYYGDQTFTLTASDPGGAGVASTWWQLDGMNPGGWTESTSVPVSAPTSASDTASHTLYWYSRDLSGNDESVQSVSFDMTAVVQEETALQLNQAVWYDTAQGATGPRVNYKIYLDDVLLPGGSFNVPVATTYSKTANWECPETAITGPGVIKIMVTADFSSHGTVYGTNSPKTFTITLPEGAKRLENVYWRGFPKMKYDLTAYDYDGYPYATVSMPAGKVDNILFATTAPDTTPPETTSNVTSGALYLDEQTFTLSSSDDGGTGTEFTKWQLDSTSGTWQTGTSVTLPPPASGSKAHTLYFYSIDYSGNQEAVKSVSFSVEALGMETTTLSLNESVWNHAIPSGSGPRVNYKVYLGDKTIADNLIASFDAPTASPAYDTGDTFNQLMPQVEIDETDAQPYTISIEVLAEFTTPGAGEDTNSTQTFTVTLPTGTKRLEAGYWRGFPDKTWGNDYFYSPQDEYPYTFVTMPTGIISSITYASTGSDLTPPATTCTVVDGATYTGDKNFILDATDADSGVESTWWKLDVGEEDSGIWHIGTSIPVKAPASGTESYTISWYSRDNATNQETTHSVEITVLADGG